MTGREQAPCGFTLPTSLADVVCDREAGHDGHHGMSLDAVEYAHVQFGPYKPTETDLYWSARTGGHSLRSAARGDSGASS